MSEQSALISRAGELVTRYRDSLSQAVVGQQDVIEQLLIAFLAGGHVLIEGVPGLGKTLLVRAMAKAFGGEYARIQFTPDLMPADVTGHVLYDMKSGEFQNRKGPVFTNLLLADEINRAPAKTQSALLEVMQERQVTLEGVAMPVPTPFMVLATQNPVEQEGTYPLPEAQLDRYLLKILIEYPDENDETRLVQQVTSEKVGDQLDVESVKTIMDADTVLKLQQLTARLTVDESVSRYAVRLVQQTREWPGISMGAGPRGSIALIRAARAAALLAGRDFVTPDDIKQLAAAVLRHRITLSPELELEGQSADQVLAGVVARVEAPRS